MQMVLPYGLQKATGTIQKPAKRFLPEPRLYTRQKQTTIEIRPVMLATAGTRNDRDDLPRLRLAERHRLTGEREV